MNAKTRIVSAKLRTGPGGIHCHCCTHWRCSARKAKALMSRLSRRVSRMALRAEVA
jgi:hypothetical protein